MPTRKSVGFARESGGFTQAQAWLGAEVHPKTGASQAVTRKAERQEAHVYPWISQVTGQRKRESDSKTRVFWVCSAAEGLKQDLLQSQNGHKQRLLLSHFSHVQTGVRPNRRQPTQALGLGLSRARNWRKLFPFPMYERKEREAFQVGKVRLLEGPHGLQPSSSLPPWIFLKEYWEWVPSPLMLYKCDWCSQIQKDINWQIQEAE